MYIFIVQYSIIVRFIIFRTYVKSSEYRLPKIRFYGRFGPCSTPVFFPVVYACIKEVSLSRSLQSGKHSGTLTFDIEHVVQFYINCTTPSLIESKPTVFLSTDICMESTSPTH